MLLCNLAWAAMNVKMLGNVITQQVMQSMFNKYEVQSDAMVEPEANFSSNQGYYEGVHFYTLFRGECKADLFVNLVRQFLALEVYF